MLLGLGISLLFAFPKEVVSLPMPQEMEFLETNPETAQILYEEWLITEKIKGVKEACSCVLFAKKLTGYNKSVGYAKNWPVNSKTPVVGGVVITNESSSGSYQTGHVAYILKIEGETMTLIEGNYKRCQKSTRTMNIDDKKIIGYWIWT